MSEELWKPSAVTLKWQAKKSTYSTTKLPFFYTKSLQERHNSNILKVHLFFLFYRDILTY